MEIMSMLKGSVFVVLVLLTLVPLTDGGCGVAPVKKGATHCQDYVDRTWHPVGSSWVNSRCVRCNCGSKLKNCCPGLPSVTLYAEDCTVEYDYDTCTLEVFKNSDRTTTCPYGASL